MILTWAHRIKAPSTLLLPENQFTNFEQSQHARLRGPKEPNKPRARRMLVANGTLHNKSTIQSNIAVSIMVIRADS